VDATLLRQAERRPNADHLFGIATECALLHLLRYEPEVRRSFLDDGAAPNELRKHVNLLWNEFCYRAGKGRRLGVALARLVSSFPADAPRRGQRWRPRNPFASWNVDQRYLSDAAAGAEITEETLAEHAQAAKVCLELLDDMRTSGGV